MIYTLTLNPCLDYVLCCDSLIQGETNRSFSEEIFPGGKGINVSYILKQLGKESVALGFIGGFTGSELEKLVAEKGIICDFINVKNGNTRINIKLKTSEITEVNASGFSLDDSDMQELYGKLNKLCSGDTLIIGGSAPKGAPDSIYEDICSYIDGKGIRLIIDTSGEKLKKCLKYRPFLIKPNKEELSQTLGKVISSQDDLLCCAKELKALGAVNVLISLGSDGACLLDEYGKYHTCSAHKIKPVNTVGAGDSMVAGFLAGSDLGYEYALKLANACGGATASCQGLADIGKIKELLG